jgi:hypothetical protein
MIWAPLIVALIAGWLLASALTRTAWADSGWMGLLGEFSLAALVGPGLASVLFFLLLLAGIASATSVFAMLAVLAAGSFTLWWRFRQTGPHPSEPAGRLSRFPWTWALLVALIAGLAVFALIFQAFTQSNPSGDWDASAIWNVRARFLAGGLELWRRALSSELGGHLFGAAHPSYPLFLSSFVALQWVGAGNFDPGAPIAAGLLFSLGAFLLVGAGLARGTSVALGLLAWLVLLGSDVFTSQAALQYSDLPLGLAFLATLVLLDRAERAGSSPRLLIAAGLALGFTPWIKNEGWPFAAAALAVAVWRFGRRGILPVTLGAAPGLAATILLKVVSQGHEALIPSTSGGISGKLLDPARWWHIFLGFGQALLGAGQWWAHPVILVAALAVALRLLPAAERRARLWLWIPIAATLAAEFGIYLLTPADLDWQVRGSASRLLAQVWPSLIWLVFLMLRSPEEYYPAHQPVQATVTAASGKRKRKHARA